MELNECDGCNLYDSTDGICITDVVPIERVKCCPCGICLVKMRCRIACSDFQDAAGSRELQ